MEGNGYFVMTPLIESFPMRWHVERQREENGVGLNKSGKACRIFLKLENTQPTASFKIRGISNLILDEYNKGARSLISASGGNAGLAAAFVAQELNIPITVFAPSSITRASTDRLHRLNAKVELVDGDWYDLDKKAKGESKSRTASYIPPFDHPIIWEGHATMIEECKIQLRGIKPDLVVVTVGGGGLLLGVAKGLDKVGWSDVPILAIYSEATSMGGVALVAEEARKLCRTSRVILEKIDNHLCYEAVNHFLNDHLMLVEPSCGAALSAVYGRVIQKLQNDATARDVTANGGGAAAAMPLDPANVLIVVCGGSGVSAALLEQWKKEYDIK